MNKDRVKAPAFHPDLHDKLLDRLKAVYGKDSIGTDPKEAPIPLLIHTCAARFYEEYKEMTRDSTLPTLVNKKGFSGDTKMMDPVLGVYHSGKKQGSSGTLDGGSHVGSMPSVDLSQRGGGLWYGLGPDKSGLGYVLPSDPGSGLDTGKFGSDGNSFSVIPDASSLTDKDDQSLGESTKTRSGTGKKK
ncbi:small capsid protein [Wood mouse herpesvirus]|uniref:Small capsid protein n=1 Tax=Wood mouse herpesvirus TaxID=432370 RepID=D0U1Q4_9GAMA|nr:small capsid protein [Wood mouse herpesvirus]ACY41135.1 small capsid protein [Wood mouse herpesvirus]